MPRRKKPLNVDDVAPSENLHHHQTLAIRAEIEQSFRFGGRRLSDDQVEDMMLHIRDRCLWRTVDSVDSGEHVSNLTDVNRLLGETNKNLAAYYELRTKRAGGPDTTIQLVWADDYDAPSQDESIRACGRCGNDYSPFKEYSGMHGTSSEPFLCAPCLCEIVQGLKS